MKINKLLKMSVVVLAGILSLGTFTGCSKSEDVIVMGTNAVHFLHSKKSKAMKS